MSVDHDQISRDLEATQKAVAEALLAQHEFQLACQHGQWERAEAARQAVLNHTEAHLDAFARACRRSRP